MAKTVSSALKTHLGSETTTLARGVKVKRTDDVTFRFTSASEDIDIDIGDGDGEQTYTASEGFRQTATQGDSDLSVDNLELIGVFDDDAIKEVELRRGLFDYADMFLFVFNHQDTSQGILKMARGKLGEVKSNPRGSFTVELRSLEQVYAQELGQTYSKDCRDDLGGNFCRVPIRPDEIERSTSVALGEVYKASNNKYIGLTLVNPDAEGSGGWTDETGSLEIGGPTPAAYEGDHFFFGGNSAETLAWQDVDIPSGQDTAVDAEERDARLTWRQNSIGGDQAEMQLEFRDESGSVIETKTTAGLTSPNDWTDRELTADVPVNTRTIRVYQRMVRQDGTPNDGMIDDIELDLIDTALIHEDYHDRIFKVTTAGTTGLRQPTYDTTVGNDTTDGTAVLEAFQSWTRSAQVDSVDVDRQKFKVTELTPDSGQAVDDQLPTSIGFPDDWFTYGAVKWETGDNAGIAMEVRSFEGDSESSPVTQTIELLVDTPFDISVGDKLSISPGCDKLLATCRDKFDNVLNFMGEPYVPGNDVLGQYPDGR